MLDSRSGPGARSLFARTGITLPVAVLAVAIFAAGCSPGADEADPQEGPASAWAGTSPESAPTGAMAVELSPDEPRLRSLTRLTHGGTNAEAYFSPHESRIVFQATWPGVSECDQIYSMAIDGSDLQQISTGEGRTTCGFFIPGRDQILFSSTHHKSPVCPTPPDRRQGYLWGLFDYDIFVRDLQTGEVSQLTDSDGYDGEATLSPDGQTIVFTSLRGGDLDLWTMDVDGSNPRQLTHTEGYEGGAFFSPDGSRIVFRAFLPETDEEREDYQSLLAQGLVRGGRLEIFVMDADGSNVRQVTDNRASSFAPFFHPNGRQIIFSANIHDPGGRSFNLYLINVDGTGLERVTRHDGFDGFPMFTRDGRRLLFASSRGGNAPGEINVFLAEWNDGEG